MKKSMKRIFVFFALGLAVFALQQKPAVTDMMADGSGPIMTSPMPGSYHVPYPPHT